MRIQKLNMGMSNVIATVLLVAVVVALVALLTFIFFNITGETSTSVDATVDLSQTSTGIKSSIVRNENAKEFIIDAPTGEFKIGESPGDTINISAGNGTYKVVGVSEDGTEQIINRITVDDVDTSGFFVVTQYEQDKKAYAELVKTYDGVNKYEIIVDSDTDDGSTISDESNIQSKLLSMGEELSPPNNKIAPGLQLDVTPNNILQVAKIDKQPNATEFSTDEDIALHKLTNLCKGDQVSLVDAESPPDNREVLATGEEIDFNMGCSDLRTVTETQGNQITNIEFINLGEKIVEPMVYNFNSDIPPVPQSIEKDGSMSLSVTVKDSSSGSTLDGASVTVGDIQSVTDSSGQVTFNGIGEMGKTVYVTATKNGYYSGQIPVYIPSDSSTGINDKTIKLDPESDTKLPENSQSVSVSPDSSTSVNIGSSGGNNDGSPTYDQSTTTGSGQVVVSGGSYLGDSDSSTSNDDTGGDSDWDLSGSISYDQTGSTVNSDSSDTTTGGIISGSSYSNSTNSIAYSSPSNPTTGVSNPEQSTVTGSEFTDLSDSGSNSNFNVEVIDNKGGGSVSDTSTTDEQISNSVDELLSDNSYSETSTDEPQKKFNVLEKDRGIVAAGSDGKFKLITSILMDPNSSQYTDKEKIQVSAISQDDGSKAVLKGSPTDQEVELTRGEVKVVSQTFYFDSGTKSGNYTIFVSLNSTSEVKTAGTLEVFDSSKLNVEIQGATVSPVDPVLDTSNGKETIDITIDESNLTNLDTAESVRLDLFENGQRVNSTIFRNGDGSYTFEQEYSKTGYYQYHVGVRESKSTVLVDTVRIDSASTISSSVSLSSNLTIKGNTGDCTSTITTVGDQFDCEIQTGESVDLSGNVTVKGSQLDQFSDVKIVLRWGDKSDQQKVLYNSSTASGSIDWSKDLSNAYSSSGYSNEITGFSNESTIEIEKNDVKYDNINAQVLDLRIIGNDSSDTRIGEQSSKSLNVVSSDDITTEITNISKVNGSKSTLKVKLQSDRVASQEEINIHFFDKSGSYVETVKNINVPPQSEKISIYNNINVTDYVNKNDDDLVLQIGITDKSINSPTISETRSYEKFKYNDIDVLNSSNTYIKSVNTNQNEITTTIRNPNPFYDDKVTVEYTGNNLQKTTELSVSKNSENSDKITVSSDKFDTTDIKNVSVRLIDNNISRNVKIENIPDVVRCLGHGKNSDDNYPISNSNEFGCIEKNMSAKYELTSDITYSDNFAESNFGGYLYGNNHILTLDDTGRLFQNINGDIENLNIYADNLNLYKLSTGALASSNDGSLFDVDVSGTIVIEEYSWTDRPSTLGGLVAYCSGYSNLNLDSEVNFDINNPNPDREVYSICQNTGTLSNNSYDTEPLRP